MLIVTAIAAFVVGHVLGLMICNHRDRAYRLCSEKKIASLLAKVESLSELCESRQNNINSLENEISDAVSHCRQCESVTETDLLSAISNLTGKLRIAERRIKNLIANHETALIGLNGQLEQQRGLVEQLRDVIESKDTKIHSLRGEYEKQQESIRINGEQIEDRDSALEQIAILMRGVRRRVIDRGGRKAAKLRVPEELQDAFQIGPRVEDEWQGSPIPPAVSTEIFVPPVKMRDDYIEKTPVVSTVPKTCLPVNVRGPDVIGRTHILGVNTYCMPPSPLVNVAESTP